MTPEQLREKRSEILETLLATFTGGGGYALGPVVDALNALEAFDAELPQITPEEANFTDEYGTRTWSGRDFDGWIARLGHGAFRKGDDRITFMDAGEIEEALQILMGMWIASKENSE